MVFRRRRLSNLRRNNYTRRIVLIFFPFVVAVVLIPNRIGDSLCPKDTTLLSTSSGKSSSARAKSDPELQKIIVKCEEVVIDKFNEGDMTWVRTATRPSFHMHVHPFQEDALSREVGTKGCYECNLLPHMIYSLQTRPDSVFIDIGANIGLYTLAAAAAGFDVVAFEPVLMSYQKMCESIQANSGLSERITVIRRAVADKAGVVKFRFWPGNHAGIATKEVNQTAADGTLYGKTEDVDFGRTLRIDSLPSSILPTNRPVALKIDIEGAECEAMAGAFEYLNKVEIVYAQIELNPARSRTRCSNIQDIADFFDRKGLQPYLMFNGQKRMDSSKANEWKSPKAGGNMDVVWFPKLR